ncbi:LRR receptor-like serine/threonine-protein kinase RGI2 [Vicia villosa]|uniref:LRR receptor-like serine/threonine-protein kinase RGI2 n=1 Tax=Vicia villosa TaxID=3911 RepID=UPI00273AD734|nr:LRR receptor-like serine/threonine-protein kinase RGI2 [Vicia villosa]
MPFYEHMEKGSLGELLHGEASSSLDWYSRFRIALGTAQGLSYLHHDCKPRIIHRDIKSNNILIDHEFEAHVGDFGLAKLIDISKSKSVSAVVGSYGYIAPEYAYTMKVTEKCDVYSYGVVLLELLTGKKPIQSLDQCGGDLVTWVTNHINKYSLKLDIIDAKLDLLDEIDVAQIFDVLKISLLCTDAYPSRRPTMRKVVAMLTISSKRKEQSLFSPCHESIRTRGKDDSIAGRASDRVDALARAADEAQVAELRVGCLPPTSSNQKQRTEQQAVAGFLAPRHRTGRAATAMVEVEESVATVEETVAEVELPVEEVEERQVLKVASHRSKLKNFPECQIPEQVRRIVQDFHVMDFVGCSLTMLDASLLSASVERWHLETSSFHLPFGEMTVTLDDVDALFHILIASTFFTPVYRDQATAVLMVMDALEVDEVVVLSEFGETRGFHLRMSCLRRIYQELVHADRYQAVARA